MGGVSGIMGFLPGMNKAAKAQMAAAGFDDGAIKRQEAIILSMTPTERAKPDILKASRKRRIAKGAGVEVPEVNKLLKMHRQMADMMKKVSKGGPGALAGMFGGKMGGMLGGMGGLPDLSKMDPKQLEQMARQAGIDPRQLEQMTGGAAPAPDLSQKLPTDVGSLLKSAPGGLPGLGGAPRFPGLPGLGGKKK
jgi:signal recognition particle subunit SRP54